MRDDEAGAIKSVMEFAGSARCARRMYLSLDGFSMSTSDLIESIKVLPPQELAAVEAYVRALPGAAENAPRSIPDPLAARIVARRERLRGKFGEFSVRDDIRVLREDDPR